MADNDNDDIDSMFEEDNDTPTTTGTPETPTTNTPDTPAVPTTTEEDPAKAPDAPVTPDGERDKPPEVPKTEAPATPDVPTVAEGASTTPEQPTEAAKPLTADEVRTILADIDTQKRDNDKALADAEQDVIKAYYPDGLPTVLIDEGTGKELRSAQDVVDAAAAQGNEMTIDQAAQWLMKEQATFDKNMADIKQSAKDLAETNYNFKQGIIKVTTDYKDIFEKYPALQAKVYNNYMKAVKIDEKKDLVLTAPDIEDYYRDFMEPYVMAFGYQPKAAPTAAPAPVATPAAPAIPESKQTAADRMDIGGDAGTGGGDVEVDKNDPEATLNNMFGE